MLSKNKIKFINTLFLKKNRDEQQLFCAEGEKCVLELFKTFECKILVTTNNWLLSNSVHAEEIITVENSEEIKKISFFKTPSTVFAVFKKPIYSFDIQELKDDLAILLDGIQDPGNIGTIIRIADWFGIRNIICAEQTVDVFNPKSIQSTMGALARVKVHYTKKDSFFKQLISSKINIPIYGTFLEGENIYSSNLSKNGLIIMGNEGNGIAEDTKKYVSKKLFIPNYPKGVPTSESLNVAIATGIVCSEFRRRL
jgi:TrmH family RNA methyltransferase